MSFNKKEVLLLTKNSKYSKFLIANKKITGSSFKFCYGKSSANGFKKVTMK